MAPPPVDHGVTESESLKAEGNALHTEGQYKQAYQKYTEAIALDEDNAVLYANRAASSLALKEYLNAASDAQRAVSIKPDYAKAWARIGTATQALSLYDASTNAWERALKCLPEDASKCTSVELRLKEQCRSGLAAVKREKEQAIRDGEAGKNVASVPLSVVDNGDMPWQRALSMVNEMQNSSGWVILNAYREFSKGVATMRATKILNGRFEGDATAITDISNGILRDPRVFHADSPDWFDRFVVQLKVETQVYGAWTTHGSDEIIKRAFELQRREGWDPVRKALALTVRGLILSGFLVWGAQQEHVPALQYYKSAITVLEWGLHTWPNVPNSERGAIFSETFVRGVRRLYLDVYLAACKFGQESEYSLDILADLARKLLEETHAHAPTGQEEWMRDPGFFLSFFIYPTAEAHATLGFVNMQKAMRSTDDVGRAMDYFAASADEYMEAGMLYPEDDEKRIYYLRVAFEARWHRGDPLGQVLPLCKLVREMNPKAERIWQYSALSPTRQAYVRSTQRFEQDAHTKILAGTYTLETPSSEIVLEN